MALPILEAVADKDEVQKVISEIATAVFKSAKVSLDSAAKAVIPSVPQMVDDVLEDLKSGSIQKFNLAMDKLDKLVITLGIDLKKYNKELANFAKRREEKIIISEEKIQTLRENNIIASKNYRMSRVSVFTTAKHSRFFVKIISNQLLISCTTWSTRKSSR